MEIIMDPAIGRIRQKLSRLGWHPKEREMSGVSGEKIWVVFSNHSSHSFSVQGGTQKEAWESAWQLVGQIRAISNKPRMILPFPNSFRFDRAA
jgi:hypothetical protein